MTDKVASIDGVIVLADGSRSSFQITTDFGWQQWGATQERLGRTVDVVEAMVAGLQEAEVLVASSDDEDD